MTVYLIADIKVKDQSWIPAYATSVHDLVHKHGGKYLARSGNVKTVEGQPLDTTLIAVMAFPTEAAAAVLPTTRITRPTSRPGSAAATAASSWWTTRTSPARSPICAKDDPGSDQRRSGLRRRLQRRLQHVLQRCSQPCQLVNS